MVGCLDPQLLERLARPDADPALRARAGVHLGGCPACREALAVAERDAALLGELRRAHDEAPAAAGAAPGVGSAVGPYRLRAELHRGPRGGVFVAETQDADQVVAVKVLFGAPWSDREDRQRFDREARLASALQHPFVVPVHTHGAAGNVRYLVMPYVRGRHLDAHVRDRGLDLRGRLELFAKVCRAVGYAHRQGVVHRDLKPQNVLVAIDGRPQVLDFGLSKPAATTDESIRGITWTGQFLGTPAYASPEQITGAAAQIGPASDVYSLGVMLCELATGQLPHDTNGSLGEVVDRIRRAEPRLRAAAGVDRALRAILRRALERDRGARHTDADALADDLERWLAGRPREIETASLWSVTRRTAWRYRRVLAVQAGVLLAVTGLAVWITSLHWSARGQRQTAAQIQSVLRELISAAQPGRMGGAVALVDVLDDVAARVHGELGAAPHVQAAVRRAIGDTYLQLFMLDEADEHLTAAVRGLRDTPAVPTSLAGAMHSLALVRTQRSDPAAVALAREALALHHGVGADHAAIARSQRVLAHALIDERSPPALAEAESLLDAAQATFAAAGSGPRGHAERGRTAHRRALLYLRRGDLPAAEQAFAGAAEALTAAGPSHAAWIVECWHDYAAVLQNRHAYADAEAMLGRAAALAQDRLGPHRSTDVLRRFARLYTQQGQLDLAAAFSCRAVAQAMRSWALRRPEDADRLRSIAARVEPGITEPGGRTALLDAFAVMRAYRGEGSFELASWAVGLGTLFVLSGDRDLAEQLTRHALTARCRVYGDDCPIRLRALTQLAEVLHDQGRCAEACELTAKAKALCQRTGRGGTASGRRAHAVADACGCDAGPDPDEGG
ncbi:MAG: serine/threonine-protein kinase [Planctomycetota bacterium]